MQKILELNSEHFFTGISPYGHVQNQGLFFKAKGVWPYVDFSYESDEVGLLQASPVAVNVTTSDVVGSMVSLLDSTGSATVYANDMGGNIYGINPLNFTKTCLRDTASITAAVGASIYNGEYLYSQATQIGARNLSTGVWTDNKYTGLQNYTIHQQHELGGNIFITDKDRVSKLSINSTGTTVITANVLDFQSSYRVKCLNDDGKYLVIGITENQGNNIYHSKTKVVFWDTFSDSWNREYELPDTTINSITKDNQSMIALCGRGAYRFSFDLRPQLMMPFTSSEAPSYSYPDSSTELQGLPIWGAYQEIFAYGSYMPNTANALFCPYTGLTAGISSILAHPYFYQIYVGGDKKIYKLITGGTGTANTGVNAQTVFIDLKQNFIVQKITVTFGQPLASGDSLNIDVASDSVSTPSDWGNISFAKHGAKQEVSLPGTFKAKLLSLKFNFNAGNPKIKRVQVWGIPDTNY